MRSGIPLPPSQNIPPGNRMNHKSGIPLINQIHPAPPPPLTNVQNSSSYHQNIPYHVKENCNKILKDITTFEKRISSLRTEIEVLQQDRNNMKANFLKYYETSYNINIELIVQNELNNRYINIIQNILTHVEPDLKSSFLRSIENAKKIDVSEIEEQINKGSAFIPHYLIGAMDDRRFGPHEHSHLKTNVQYPDIYHHAHGGNPKPYPNSPSDRMGGCSSINSQYSLRHETLIDCGFRNSSRFALKSIINTDDQKRSPTKKKGKVDLKQHQKEYKCQDGPENIQIDDRNERFVPIASDISKRGRIVTNKNFESADQSSYYDESKEEIHAECFSGPNIPSNAILSGDLEHNGIVCTVTISSDYQRVFTGEGGSIKIWDVQAKTMLANLPCSGESYIRSCKLLPDNSKLIVAGEFESICLWDVAVAVPRFIGHLKSDSKACYALAISAETSIQRSPLCFACCSDGNVNVWDVHNQTLVRSFKAHEDGVSSLDIFSDGSKLVTGGLDQCVRVWDLIGDGEIKRYPFYHKVFSLGVSPISGSIAVGLKNNTVEVFDLNKQHRPYSLNLHDNWVLSLKFSQKGNWFLTTGKDCVVAAWRSPYGACLFQKIQRSSVLCCDISKDDNFLIVGSKKHAYIYDIKY